MFLWHYNLQMAEMSGKHMDFAQCFAVQSALNLNCFLFGSTMLYIVRVHVSAGSSEMVTNLALTFYFFLGILAHNISVIFYYMYIYIYTPTYSIYECKRR